MTNKILEKKIQLRNKFVLNLNSNIYNKMVANKKLTDLLKEKGFKYSSLLKTENDYKIIFHFEEEENDYKITYNPTKTQASFTINSSILNEEFTSYKQYEITFYSDCIKLKNGKKILVTETFKLKPIPND